MSYCASCGNKLNEESKFCPNCGKSLENKQITNQQSVSNGTQQYQMPYQAHQTINQPYYVTRRNVIQELSKKIQIQAIIWLIVACIQYLIGAVRVWQCRDMYYDYELTGVLMGVIIIAIAIINTVFSVQNFKYSQEILEEPLEIVDKYTPISGTIITLIYNLFLGGIIGVVGAVYAFVIRSFVVKNKVEFMKIEQEFIS